jgi:hypothetical protein
MILLCVLALFALVMVATDVATAKGFERSACTSCEKSVTVTTTAEPAMPKVTQGVLVKTLRITRNRKVKVTTENSEPKEQKQETIVKMQAAETKPAMESSKERVRECVLVCVPIGKTSRGGVL